MLQKVKESGNSLKTIVAINVMQEDIFWSE